MSGMENFLISEELKKVNQSMASMVDNIGSIEKCITPGDEKNAEPVTDLLKVICYYLRGIKESMDFYTKEDDDENDDAVQRIKEKGETEEKEEEVE